MSDNFNKNRLAKNTILLYVRMLFTMWLNLYTTRLTLANLGVEDMGVYGVVGSVVSMFAVFSGGIGNAVQRFLTYEIGREGGDPNRVFCSCLNVIFILLFVIFILLEVGGLWFLHNKVNIPTESMDAAQWVFQLSVLTCLVNLVSIPYNSLIVAHEKMDAFAVISILQVVLTCASAYCLSYFTDGRLLIYAILMASISILIRIIYQIYCHRKFPEARYRMIIDRQQIKQISKYAGVSSVSGILQVLSSQGITFVINIVFGVAINAVYSIAFQVKLSIMSFALNLFKAISPQITKTFANKEFEVCKKLVFSGSKLEIFLIYFILMPFVCKADYIMKLWLGNVPSYAVEFSISMVFLSLIYAMFEPIRTLVLATNKIAKFMIIPDVFYLVVLPLAYLVGKITNNPINLILIIVGMDIISCLIRIFYATKVSPVTMMEIMKHVILKSVSVGLLNFTTCYLLSVLLPTSFVGLVMLILFNSLILSFIILLCGMDVSEKRFIMTAFDKIKAIYNRV